MKEFIHITPQEAVSKVESHNHIHISGAAQIPHCLIVALTERAVAGELEDIHFHHSYSSLLFGGGEALYADAKFRGVFFDETFFAGPAVRDSIKTCMADYIPSHLEDTQKCYRSGTISCDVAFIVVSEPTTDGYVSLGGDVVCTLGAIDVTKTVIAVVNKNVP